ncbi:hypothetical protein KSP40_PGU022654 [Platanthera guangdongensis]|uniref:Uncharacterized protein n=1 Tax=Platanthera guangdongensis TaxID=2320717 RepID=A0ABR2LM46_9ASPA
MTRSSKAKILIEMDISRQQSEKIWLGSASNGYAQKVLFENVFHYCNHYSITCHAVDFCFSKYPEPKPNKQLIQTKSNVIKNDLQKISLNNNSQIL